ncbi:putative membrane protein YjcC [mine drainage metagenome]|uniref:Putative membrane protein YjcC n=1 Tax=mine drainage metagenome TaxID=410659 RepID=A0A1J5PU08_9ZZZZ
MALANLNRMGVRLTSFGDASAQSRAAMELTMEAALRRTLQSTGLIAAMQPVYRVSDTRIIGAEMLARWTWEDHQIPPVTFVSLAERTGLIGELSRHIRGIALEHLSKFVAAAGQEPWRTWINVSPRELIETNFADRFLAELEATRTDPTRIGLEITETALLTNPQLAENTLRELRQAGVHIALDDFGTGYSSLSLLKDISVDAVKIDRSFTMSLPTDQRVSAIVSGVIASANAMGVEVIAEGVETIEQFEWLAENGCHSAQGFLFTEAMAPEQLLELMAPPTEN